MSSLDFDDDLFFEAKPSPTRGQRAFIWVLIVIGILLLVSAITYLVLESDQHNDPNKKENNAQ